MPFIGKVNANEKPAIIDNSTPGTSYVGYPAAAAADTDAEWAIKKIVTAANVMTITWAGGTIEKKHKWSERAALNYSRI